MNQAEREKINLKKSRNNDLMFYIVVVMFIALSICIGIVSFSKRYKPDESLYIDYDLSKDNRVIVTLYGKIGSVNKGYRLLETEYNLLENTGDATFVIEIENIKSICKGFRYAYSSVFVIKACILLFKNKNVA